MTLWKSRVVGQIILGVALLFLADSAWAKREMILFGGGGEPEGPTTIFDETLEHHPMFGKKMGWRTQVYFDGGHATSEELSSRISGGSSQPLTKESMDAALENLKQRIIAGDLGAGDQLLITIATHGAQQSMSQRTHSVATTNGTYDLDKLIEIRDMAEARGIQLAVADFSCHSGPMLDLGTDKTCVITAANDDVGYVDTGLATVKAMTAGSNLEAAFLEGRRTLNRAAPQISTDAGKRSYADTNFLTEITFRNRQLDEVLSERSQICGKDQGAQFKELSLQIQSLVKDSETSATLVPLEQALKDYEQVRSELQMLEARVNKSDNRVCTGTPEICLTRSKWQHEMRYKKPKYDLLPAQARRFELAQIIGQTEAQKRFAEQLEVKLHKQDELRRAALKVSEVEREVYGQLYRRYSTTSMKPNPCKDFKL